MSHKDLSLSGIRVTGETSCDALYKLSAAATQDLPLLECNLSNNMADRVPTHVPALRRHLLCGCPNYSCAMHAACPLETLTLMGLSASKGYLRLLDLNVLYTPHA